MKKLLGLGFILAALAVVTMGMGGFPKLDVNIWPLFPVLLFAFFTLENLMKQAMENGVKLVACTMSMDVMGIRKEEIIDGVEFAGVASYLGDAENSDVNLFI